jgi:hypothetical protein
MPSIVIAQGGGPTAVINQTQCGAILAARRHDPSVRILRARYGVRGLRRRGPTPPPRQHAQFGSRLDPRQTRFWRVR